MLPVAGPPTANAGRGVRRPTLPPAGQPREAMSRLAPAPGLSGGTTANRWEFWDGSSWNQASGTTDAGEIEEKGMDVNVVHSGLTIGMVTEIETDDKKDD